MEKIDPKKMKTLYQPPTEPTLITVPPMSFYVIAGTGSPADKAYADVVGALYALSYAVKMLPKKGPAPAGYVEYSVFPLEGVWDLIPGETVYDPRHKENLAYRMMIRQPDFVTPALAAEVLEAVKVKKPNPALGGACFEQAEEGLCLQMMHVGPYDDEPRSFAKMDAFCEANGYGRVGKTHREIYLGDPRKTAPDKLRTVLRYSIEKLV